MRLKGNRFKQNDVADRFWCKVDKSGDCWEWLACKNKKGYGHFGMADRSNRLAHRVSLWLSGGMDDLNSPLFVCHSCDNPSCVNPDHLFLGTAKANNDDMMKKGRSHDRKAYLINTKELVKNYMSAMTATSS